MKDYRLARNLPFAHKGAKIRIKDKEILADHSGFTQKFADRDLIGIVIAPLEELDNLIEQGWIIEKVKPLEGWIVVDRCANIDHRILLFEDEAKTIVKRDDKNYPHNAPHRAVHIREVIE